MMMLREGRRGIRGGCSCCGPLLALLLLLLLLLVVRPLVWRVAVVVLAWVLRVLLLLSVVLVKIIVILVMMMVMVMGLLLVMMRREVSAAGRAEEGGLRVFRGLVRARVAVGLLLAEQALPLAQLRFQQCGVRLHLLFREPEDVVHGDDDGVELVRDVRWQTFPGAGVDGVRVEQGTERGSRDCHSLPWAHVIEVLIPWATAEDVGELRPRGYRGQNSATTLHTVAGISR